MKTTYLISFIILVVCLGNIPAQQRHAQDSDTYVLKNKMDLCELITWKGNILHTVCKIDKPLEKGLQKLIKDAEHEVKNMQKTVAVVEQKTDSDKKGIFQFRKAAEGLTEGKPRIIIR